MGGEFPGMFGGLGLGQSLRRWQRDLRSPSGLSLGALSRIDGDIRDLRDRLDRMAVRARSELAGRVLDGGGIARPDQDDWALRPAPWQAEMRPRGFIGLTSPQALPGGVSVFHDAGDAELSLRQERAFPGAGPAPFGLVLEVYGSDARFVSLVQDLPPAALDGLGPNHVISVRLEAEREQAVDLYARLNIRHGPNVEQIVAQVAFTGAQGLAEFDLAHARIDERRLERAWLDLIVAAPRMTRLALWDMVIARRPRADL